MKIIYSLILIVLSISLSLALCNNGCKQIGEECTEGDICSDYSVCVYNATTQIGTCTAKTGLNSECIDNENCELGLLCYKANNNDLKGLCLNVKFALIGERCSNTIDCASSYSNCTNSICTKLPENGNTCLQSEDCEVGSVCVNKICTVPLDIGGSCKTNTDCNRLFGFCAPNQDTEKNGTCTKYFTLEEGDNCNQEYQCDSNKNLYCNDISKKCMVYKFVEPTLGLCKSTEQCNYGLNGTTAESVCDCGDGLCVQYKLISSSERNTILNLYSCANSSNCGFLINPTIQNGCIRKNCAAQYCEFNKMYNKFDSCNSYQTVSNILCGTTNSSSKLLPSIFIIISFIIYLII